jgi:predicted RNA-binding protein YlxR (DUF448 family)
MAEPASEEDDAMAGGPAERTCIVTRAVLPQSRLLRFVAGPDGMIVPDMRARLPGRGVWITLSQARVAEAARKNLFARALRRSVRVPDGLADQVAALLARDALQMLALANKAGAVTTGFDKIAGLARPIAMLVQASDGSPAELERLVRHCRSSGAGGGAPDVCRLFTSRDLALSIGREHVINAALSVQGVSAVFGDRARRYAEYKSDGPAVPAMAPTSGPTGIADAPEP